MSRDDEAALLTPPAATAHRWRLRGGSLDLTSPQIMAICNVTPDSFSDGGVHESVESALHFAAAARRDGATILDIGGESTRPGATPVSVDQELSRVIPVIEAVRDRVPDLIITIDTVKADVARAALQAGAHGVNDVSGGRLDAAMFDVVTEHGAGMVVMHSRGGVPDMASLAHANYDADVVAQVCDELTARVGQARAAGLLDAAIVLDPGIGFAKTSRHSLALLRELSRVVALGFPVLVGASRKRLIGELTGVSAPAERVIGSAVVHAFAVHRGARIIRTHDVAATREAVAVAVALDPP
jgi:dihydropteroate synthase